MGLVASRAQKEQDAECPLRLVLMLLRRVSPSSPTQPAPPGFAFLLKSWVEMLLKALVVIREELDEGGCEKRRKFAVSRCARCRVYTPEGSRTHARTR